MLPLVAFLCLALSSVTAARHILPALAVSDSGNSEETLDMIVSPVSRRETASSDMGTGIQLSQDVLSELRKTQDLVFQLRTRLGSTYIRWGRKSCPANTSLVYTGVAGGKWYSKDTPGGGTNPLCLTNAPQFDNANSNGGAAYLFGGEYQFSHGHWNHDVPCSVCLTPRVSTIMIPATLTCPPGWTPQYTGHLAAEKYDHTPSQYVCLDQEPENYDSGVRDDNGLLFHYVLTRCGSLPCPPYVNDKVVTCVVCSK